MDAAINDWTEAYVMHASGIEENQEYQRYLELDGSGDLNENGEYNELDKAEYQAEGQGTTKPIHVTIAQNSFLQIEYFYDSGLTEKVEGDSVFMNPGDKLFCSQPESDNSYSNTYVFSQFQIFEFDEDGNKGDLWNTTGENHIVLDIPEDFEGTELSIMPIGKYEKRGITFSAFYYDEDGVSKKVPGVWYVNDVACMDDTADVSASDSYTVKYKYDENAYYYVSANPSPYNSDMAGMIEFKKATALSNTDSYSVQLHKLIEAEFSCENGKKGIASIEKNGVLIEDFDNMTLGGLKEGDRLVITTNENYRIFCSGILMNDPEKVNEGFRYTVIIPSANESKYVFNLSKSELKVSLDASIGYDMAFDIIAAGVREKDCYYTKQTRDRDLIIFEDTIGIDEGLEISAKEAEIRPGNAVKLDIRKTDGNKESVNEIKYILTTPGSAQIDLYSGSGELKNLNKIYKEITVEISLAEVMKYTVQTVPHASISVRVADRDSQEPLKDGESIEGDRKVEVTISPESGYYVSGKDVENNIYREIMKFSKYESDIDTIIKKHEIKEMYSITLDSTDPYGTVTYKVNGSERNGAIDIREEDELVLVYELTDDNYEIVRNSDGFWSGLNDWRKNTFSKKSEEVTIRLTDEINGTTIKRSDYIEVSEKTKEK